MSALKTRLRVWWVRQAQRGKPGNRPRWLLLCLVFIAAFCVTVAWVQTHLRPIISHMAEVRVEYLAVKAMNEAVNRKIIQDNVGYDSLIYFEKDIYGQITALKTNMIGVNRLKTEIVEDVLASLSKISHSELAIPLGNLTGADILSGRGPRIPIRIVPLGVVEANFSNEFGSAGINQTRHQIMMEIHVDVSVLFPGYSADKKVTTQVCVAETVIVGNVPDSYLNFGDSGIFQREP